MSSTTTSLGEEIYTGTASFGKVWTVIQAVLGTIVGIVFIVLGSYIIKHRDHLLSTEGTIVKNSDCAPVNDGKKMTMSCMSYIMYTVNDKTYGSKDKGVSVGTGSTEYKEGDKVTVYYDPTTPNVPEINPVPKAVGWAIIGISVFVVLMSWLWAWLASRYKMAAAIGGVSGLKSVFN